jgi:hypothetical protein
MDSATRVRVKVEGIGNWNIVSICALLIAQSQGVIHLEMFRTMADNSNTFFRERVWPSKEVRAERKAARAIEADVAMAEHEAAEQFKYANMERLKIMRLAAAQLTAATGGNARSKVAPKRRAKV